MSDFIFPNQDWSIDDADDSDLFGSDAIPPASPFPPSVPPITDSISGIRLEQVLEQRNVTTAWEKVRRKRGCAGADGWKISQLQENFPLHWQPVATSVRAGTWQPQPLLRVEIPKPTGGIRVLSIPSVLDRVLLQAVAQVLAPHWEPRFLPQSYAYRPGRSPLQAVEAAREMFAGCAHAWHLDLADFFGTVPHAPLLAQLAAGGVPGEMLTLISRSLEAPVLSRSSLQPSTEGIPQGSPLSPLLANIYLTPFDAAQHAAQRPFCRYADNILLFSSQWETPADTYAAVLQSLASLGLTLNQSKSGLAPANETEFLGYGFWRSHPAAPRWQLRIAPSALGAGKLRLTELARPSPDFLTVDDRRQAMAQFLRSWMTYFQSTDRPEDVADILAHAETCGGLRPEDVWPTQQGSQPAPETARRATSMDYQGRPSLHPVPTGDKLAIAKHWATRLLRNGTVRCGLEMGSKRGCLLPRPTAFRVTVLGHSIKFKL